MVAAGGTAANATTLTTAADAVIAAYDATDTAKTAYEGRKAMEEDADATHLATIRTALTALEPTAASGNKTSSGVTWSIE